MIDGYKMIPNPNMPEKTPHITVFCFTRLLSAKNPANKAHAIPAANAPIMSRIPIIHAKTMPGSTAWLTASPIGGQPFITKKHDSKAVGGEFDSAFQNALCID